MAETRMLPKANPRSTGIARTTPQGVRPAATSGGHVSASPAASHATHAHVVNARAPGAAASAASAASAAAAAPGRQVIHVAAQPASGRGSQRPTVQIVDRSKIEDGPVYGAPATGQAALAPPAVAQPFSGDQLLLICHLAGRFRDGAIQANDVKNLELAQGTLDAATAWLQAVTAAQSTPQVAEPTQVIQTPSGAAFAQSVKIVAAAPRAAQGAGQVAEGAAQDQAATVEVEVAVDEAAADEVATRSGEAAAG